MDKVVPSFDELEHNESRVASMRHFGNTIPLYWREDG
jgi:hypothetical protein